MGWPLSETRGSCVTQITKAPAVNLSKMVTYELRVVNFRFFEISAKIKKSAPFMKMYTS